MNSFFKTILVFIVCSLCFHTICGAEKGFIKSLDKTTDLPTTDIYDIKFDTDGFTWLATDKGLFRFDGYEYEHHAFKEKHSKLREIKKMQLDSYGRIWLLTIKDILYYYTPKSKELVEVNFKALTKVTGIAVNDSVLFINIKDRSAYIFIHQDIGHQIEPTLIKNCKSLGTNFSSTQTKAEKFFLRKQIIVLDTKKEISIKKSIETRVNVVDAVTDAHDNEWICNGKKVFKLEKGNNDWKQISGINKTARSLIYDKQRQRIWVLCHDEVFFIDEHNSSATKLYLRNSKRKKSIGFKHLFLDKKGNLWIIGENESFIISFPKNSFEDERLNKISNNSPITSLCLATQNTLWCSIHKKGILAIDTKTMQEKWQLRNYARFFVPMTDTSIAIGFQGRTDKYVYKHTKSPEIVNTRRTHRYALGTFFKENLVWHASLESIAQHDLSLNKKLQSYKIKMNPNDIQYDSSKHSLLLSSKVKGLFIIKLNNKDSIVNIQNINKEKGLYSNYIATTFSQGNILWLASSAGLIKLVYNDTENRYDIIRNYTMKDGLSHNNVVSIVAENDSILWLGTSNGLNKFNTSQETIVTYLKNKGFSNDRFTNKSAVKLLDGRLIFGTRVGFISFYPKDLKVSKQQYPTYVELLSINGKETNELSTLNNLSYEQNNLKLKVRIPNYVFQRSIRYRYKLREEDPWKYQFAKNNEIAFYNLAFGHYKFFLQTNNEDNVWNSQIVSIPIYIKPPFWLRWWFIFACILLIASGIIFYIRFSIKQLSEKSEFGLKLALEKKLRETDKEKIKFFTNVSHELKTPLTMISEPIEKINSETLADEERQFLLRKVAKNTNRLIHLVHKTLDFSTIEHQGLILNIQHIEITSFVEKIIHAFEGKAKEKEVSVIFETTEKELSLAIDKEKIERVFFNSLNDVLLYTKPQGSIQLSIERTQDGSEVLFVLKNIASPSRANKLKALFNRVYFYKATMQKQRMDLSMVNEYVQAHQGRIDVKTGHRMELNIYLPIAQHEVIDTYTSVEKEDLELPSLENEAAKTVLIVEDDKELRDYMRYELSSDFLLYHAKDGEEGIALATAKLPDIIITDYMMPKMSGEDLCKRLKSTPETSHIPIIMFTAMGNSETELLQSGANDFIAKPFKIKNLKFKIKNLLLTLDKTKDWVERELNLIPQPSEYEESDESRFVKALMNIIEENLTSEKLNVNFLAKEIGISKTVLYKKCVKLTGYRVNELITSVRLKKAAELIINTKYSFSEITNMLGYNSLRHFRNLFKKKYGMTMSEYRLRHK